MNVTKQVYTTATFVAVVHPRTRISYIFVTCRYLSIFGILKVLIINIGEYCQQSVSEVWLRLVEK